MLLPSALPCDVLRRPSARPRIAPNRLSTTSPSDHDTLYYQDPGTSNGLLGTCRALQSLLNGSPAPPPKRSKPPPRLQSPAQIRRSQQSQRKQTAAKLSPPESPQQPRRHLQRRLRGANKRRRSDYESDDNNNDDDNNNNNSNNNNSNNTVNDYDMDTDLDADANSLSTKRFSTPKRRRQLPYDLPLGLSQSDFYSLRSPPVTRSPSTLSPVKQCVLRPSASFADPDAALPSVEEGDGMSVDDDVCWSSEDDRKLVELVLGRFKPSSRDWDACARRLGRDSAVVGQRWNDLLGEGSVGLRG